MVKALEVQYQVTSHLNQFTTVSKKRKLEFMQHIQSTDDENWQNTSL